jgi:predicted nucleotidyltransferase
MYEGKLLVVTTRVLIRNTCSPRKIDRRYQPIIEGDIETYRALFGADLVDIRLMGSVARGQAIAGESDIDFLALVRGAPQPATLEHLVRREDALCEAHPVVGRVDLEVECLDRLSEFRRLVLSSDSLSVFGTDQLTRSHQYVDRAELARLVTPPAHALIRDYRAAIEVMDANNPRPPRPVRAGHR